MAHLKTIWCLIALALTGLYMTLVEGPRLVVWMLYVRLAGFTGRERRRAFSLWMFGSNRRIFKVVRFLMGIRTDYRFMLDIGGRPPPAIVLSNHQSSTDILLLLDLLPHMGYHDARWTLKDSLRWVPIIGTVPARNGSAFIDRDDPDGALRIIGESAALANDDQASFIIFPEGTRWVPRDGGYPDPAGGPPYMRVRAPKPRGFETARRQMPEHDVLIVRISWEGDVSAKTILQYGELVGKRVHVDVARHRDLAGREPAEWLTLQWRHLEANLSPR